MDVHDMAAGSMYLGEVFEIGVIQVYICKGLSANKIALHSPLIILCSSFVSFLEVFFSTILECWVKHEPKIRCEAKPFTWLLVTSTSGWIPMDNNHSHIKSQTRMQILLWKG
jgi:hypothetical protein